MTAHRGSRTPSRVQRTRTEGGGMPAGAQYIGRPGIFGNPISAAPPSGRVTCPPQVQGRRLAEAGYRIWVALPEQADLRAMARQRLAGADLACWCPVPGPCHGNPLLDVANGTEETLVQPPALVVATRGLPGSGKTTWATWWLQVLADAYVPVARLSRDDVRAQLGLHPARTTREDEAAVTLAHHAGITSLLDQVRVVVVDDTHLLDEHLAHTQAVAAAAGAVVEVVDLRGVHARTCIARDARRQGVARVGAERIQLMAEQHRS